MSAAHAEARRARDANPAWYHSIELAPGVVTPGQVDLRGLAARVLPDDLSGLRALDVGTFDGFWAFELERRGAQVIAIDVERLEAAEWPPLSRERLEREGARAGRGTGPGVRARRRGARLGGRATARERLRTLPRGRRRARRPRLQRRDHAAPARPGAGAGADRRRAGRGRGAAAAGAVLAPADLLSPRRPAASFGAAVEGFTWWLPNLAALGGWLRAAGLRDERRLAVLRPPRRGPIRHWQAAYAARR